MKMTEEKNEKRQKRGLYFALAVCLVAIAVAGSATYTSVMEYVEDPGTSAVTAQDEDPETTGNQLQEASRPEVILNEEESSEEPENSQEETAEDTAAEPVEEQSAAPEEASVAEEAPAAETQETGTQTYEPSESMSFPVKEKESMQDFSAGNLVYSDTMRDYRTHDGVDFAAEEGETVYAVANGMVTAAYQDLLLGNVVEIEHGDYVVRYCGLGDTFLVEEDEIVVKGTPIGSVTVVPMEQGDECHLHLEVRQGEEFVDPMTVLTDQ